MIFLIPARAGSKRLPGKNKRMFCGLPLWRWSAATAMRLAQPGDVIEVSTDDPDIIYDWPSRPRPKDLCADDSPTDDLIQYMFGYRSTHDSIVLLQPTSPTRPDSLVRMMIARGDACRSVTDGVPNGQCWIYRKGMTMVDVETDPLHDIDTLFQFNEAEKYMLEKFK